MPDAFQSRLMASQVGIQPQLATPARNGFERRVPPRGTLPPCHTRRQQLYSLFCLQQTEICCVGSGGGVPRLWVLGGLFWNCLTFPRPTLRDTVSKQAVTQGSGVVYLLGPCLNLHVLRDQKSLIPVQIQSGGENISRGSLWEFRHSIRQNQP